GQPANVVTNNIFVDGQLSQALFIDSPADTVSNNIVYYRAKPCPPPALNCNATQIYGTRFGAPVIGSSDRNLLFSPDDPNFQASMSFVRGLGLEADSITVDPLFTDAANDNFTLLDTSPALVPVGAGGIGFVQIDFTGLPP